MIKQLKKVDALLEQINDEVLKHLIIDELLSLLLVMCITAPKLEKELKKLIASLDKQGE